MLICSNLMVSTLHNIMWSMRENQGEKSGGSRFGFTTFPEEGCVVPPGDFSLLSFQKFSSNGLFPLFQLLVTHKIVLYLFSFIIIIQKQL